MTELKPCPFCGGNAYFHRYSLTAKRIAAQHNQPIVPMIVCESCGATVSFNNQDSSVHDASAARYWNNRTERTCVTITSPLGVHACSECGEHFSLADCETDLADKPNYCPNCGAKVAE